MLKQIYCWCCILFLLVLFIFGFPLNIVGFGTLDGNLWAGLDHLHAMTVAYDMELHVYMETFGGDAAYAQYSGLVA